MPPTRTPRVQITLKPETRAIFSRLAEAQERPEATIIAEFLDETAPALSNVVRVVQRAKNAIARVGQQERERFAHAESQLLQIAADSLRNVDRIDDVVNQYGLDLGEISGEKAAEPPSRPNTPISDPPDTNRGVNTGRRGTARRSI